MSEDVQNRVDVEEVPPGQHGHPNDIQEPLFDKKHVGLVDAYAPVPAQLVELLDGDAGRRALPLHLTAVVCNPNGDEEAVPPRHTRCVDSARRIICFLHEVVESASNQIHEDNVCFQFAEASVAGDSQLQCTSQCFAMDILVCNAVISKVLAT